MALTSGCQAYWKADESSGNMSDSTANANTLVNGSSVPFVAAKINNGTDLESGSTDYFSIADASQSGLDLTGDFTITAWLNPESISALHVLASKDQGQPNRSYAVGLRDIAGTKYMEWLLSTDGQNANTNNYRVASASITTGSFKFYVWTYTSSSGSCQGYINNTSIGSTTGSSGIYNSTADFQLGRSETANYFDGIADEIGVWNRVLTSGELTTLYNGGTGIQYPFGEAAADTSFFMGANF